MLFSVECCYWDVLQKCEFTETCRDRHPASLHTICEPLILEDWKPKSLKFLVAQLQLRKQWMFYICLELLFVPHTTSEPKLERRYKGINKYKELLLITSVAASLPYISGSNCQGRL